MRVVGVDENGLGPGLGPLVVTAIALSLPGDEGDPDAVADACRLDRLGLPPEFADSKKVFKRNPRSYARGECAALALLARAGLPAGDLETVVGELTRDREPDGAGLGAGCRAGRDLHLGPLSLPLWSEPGAPLGEALRGALDGAGIEVLDVACRVLLPSGFNDRRQGAGGKFALDYDLFEEALALLDPLPPLGLLGKIGSTRRYVPWLERSGRLAGIEVLAEQRAESRYRARLGGTPLELRFVRDGDDLYLPIALASVVGKYVREAMMLCLNRALGLELDGDLPYASGYWSDRRTREAIERFDAGLGAGPGEALARGELVRDG